MGAVHAVASSDSVSLSVPPHRNSKQVNESRFSDTQNCELSVLLDNCKRIKGVATWDKLA